jgi:hypothetical protein
MKGFLAIVACASAVVALPSPSDGNETEANTNYLVQSTARPELLLRANRQRFGCVRLLVFYHPLRRFPCRSTQILASNLSSRPQAKHFQGVDKQRILHQYCDQEFRNDALSCHACKKWPWPLDYCWDGPGAWNSVFECTEGLEYTFKERCNWCEAGKCV